MHEEIELQLRKHVDVLAGLIGPRYLARPSTIETTLKYLEGVWHQQGYEVRREEYQALEQTATNLIVETSGGKRSDEIILLGAHYDTVSATPGADDNASAVAVMLEVSRLLIGFAGQRTIRYVAFACEEPPYFHLDLMGSQIHARGCRNRNEKIIGMLCLEMVGYYAEEQNSQLIPETIPKLLRRFFPTRGNFLASVGNLTSLGLAWNFHRGFRKGTRNLPLFSVCLPERIREIRLSDNSSFWDQNYPALMLTDTSFLRNPNYHQATDLPGTLDYTRMTEVVRGVASAIKRMLR
ncbi:MAG: M28 family peptidase [Planctomycetaceae bacterium]|nr:M28 family peptidase [Planctomycetaceae bacterium]